MQNTVHLRSLKSSIANEYRENLDHQLREEQKIANELRHEVSNARESSSILEADLDSLRQVCLIFLSNGVHDTMSRVSLSS